MSSTREQGSRLQIHTLVIASMASLAAALVVSQFWINGTPIAAALTPVIVAIVSELLHRPTEAIAKRVTTERSALLPEASGAGPADSGEAPPPPARDLEGPPSQVRVYRSERRRWGRIHPRVVVLTAVLAFAVAAAALTLPELIAGQSVGNGDRKTSFFGGRDRKSADDEPEDRERTAPQEEEQPQQETVPQVTVPTVPEEEATPPTVPQTTPTVPTVPQQTTPVQP
jgi:hypothetical protein